MPFLPDPLIPTFPKGASLSVFHRRRSRNSLLEGQPEATAPDAPGDEGGVLVDVVEPPRYHVRIGRTCSRWRCSAPARRVLAASAAGPRSLEISRSHRDMRSTKVSPSQLKLSPCSDSCAHPPCTRAAARHRLRPQRTSGTPACNGRLRVSLRPGAAPCLGLGCSFLG